MKFDSARSSICGGLFKLLSSANIRTHQTFKEDKWDWEKCVLLFIKSLTYNIIMIF